MLHEFVSICCGLLLLFVFLFLRCAFCSRVFLFPAASGFSPCACGFVVCFCLQYDNSKILPLCEAIYLLQNILFLPYIFIGTSLFFKSSKYRCCRKNEQRYRGPKRRRSLLLTKNRSGKELEMRFFQKIFAHIKGASKKSLYIQFHPLRTRARIAMIKRQKCTRQGCRQQQYRYFCKAIGKKYGNKQHKSRFG